MLRPADTITFGEVLRLFEGPLAPLPCLSRQAYRRFEDCVNEQACDVRREFGRAYDAYRAILDSRTLGHAMKREEREGQKDQTESRNARTRKLSCMPLLTNLFRAHCRERECQDMKLSLAAGSFK